MIDLETPITMSLFKRISLYGYYFSRIILVVSVLTYEVIENWWMTVFAIICPDMYCAMYHKTLTTYTLYVVAIYLAAIIVYLISSMLNFYQNRMLERRDEIIKQLTHLKKNNKLDLTSEEWDNVLLMKSKDLEKWYFDYIKSKHWALVKKERDNNG